MARVRAGSGVTSRPNSSTEPEVTGKSPQTRLKSVVLPAPFGPRIARRSPGADVEVDVAHRVETTEPPADPPQAEGRLGVFGCYCFAPSAYLRTWLVILPPETTLILPCQGVLTFLHAGCVRPGGGLDGVKRPPND